MPKVGKKHYPYTDSGRKRAYMEASKTGERISNVTGPNKPKNPKLRKRRNPRKLRPYKMNTKI